MAAPTPPQTVLAACDPALGALPPHDQEIFRLRLERWWADLVEGLAGAYDGADELAGRLAVLAARSWAQRPQDLRRHDLRRSLEPDWFQRPDVVGYAAYADRFAGDLAGVATRVEHLRRLGVRYLHLMPLLRSRPGDDDGGYAVADYRQVREDLGDVEDLRALATTLRGHGISLCLDLVLNHVAREHAWAQAARAGDPRYRGYFHVFADRAVPDAFEATLPEVFPDFAPGSFTWDDDLDGWVWTTFNAFQWDLDWSNPEVLVEMVGVVLHLANLGVEVLRLDAIAFLWKRLGTDCQNQPEVHAITQALHALTRVAAPATLLKAEAIVGPGQLVGYLGQGRHHGKVSDLAYHNSLMVQTWSMLASRDVTLAAEALQAIPPVPTTTAWITYVRCHDDIGWAVDDADAAAVGLSGPGHRAFLSDFYSGRFPGSFADGLVFQHNPATGDRRISGTTASLCGVGAAGDDPGRLDDAIARVLLAHALALGWGGVPVIWSGDEVAALNDAGWAGEPGHEGDNRWAHRPRLDWDAVERAERSLASPVHAPLPAPAAVLGGLRRLVAARAGTEQLHAAVASQALAAPDRGVLVVLRDHWAGPFVGLYNVTEQTRWVEGWWLRDLGLDPADAVDRISGAAPPTEDDGAVRLDGYRVLWLTARGG
ncbi:alpha-amylase family protein [Thalassiella azotivora]